MIAETLAGIALVKQSVDFIKTHINTAKDIGELAGHIDGLFKGEQEVQKQRGRKSSVGIADQFGVQSVAKEMIDAKIAQEKLQEIASMIDMRFGPGTWKSIVAERAKRIQEAKEAAAAERRKKIQEAKEFEETMKQIALVAGVLIMSIGMFVYLFAVVL